MPKSKTKKQARSTKKPSGGKSKAMASGAGLYIIQITNGIPVMPNGNATMGELIQFQNNDQITYSIRFVVSSTQSFAGILLPPKGTVPGLCVLTASALGTVTYDLAPWGTSRGRERVATGGPHTIIISSGLGAKAANSAS